MRNTRHIGTGLIVLAMAMTLAPCQAGEIKISYAHNLSDFTGTIPVSHASLAIDRDFGETYMVYQNVVRIFNDAGMETFSFGDPDTGLLILGVAVGDGDIFALVRSFRPSETESLYMIEHRNYRGELLATHRITGIPEDHPQLDPSKIFFRDGNLLLVDKSRLLVAETDTEGAVVRMHDIAEMMSVHSNEDQSIQISGFNLDPDGNMLLTIPTFFQAFVIAADGTIRGFGHGGSVPGTFGVVAGIAADGLGRTYVSDRLRSVVIVFDADYNFIMEFGYRGRKPENLISPDELVIDKSGNLYVTQRRDRGVAVFNVTDTDRTNPESAQTQDRKEVLANSAGDTYEESMNRTNSGSIKYRSNKNTTDSVGPETKPISNGLGALDNRAITGLRYEEKP
jgi:hypothetical protein